VVSDSKFILQDVAKEKSLTLTAGKHEKGNVVVIDNKPKRAGKLLG